MANVGLKAPTWLQKVPLEPVLVQFFFKKYTMLSAIKKLGKVTDLGNPNLNIERVAVEKPQEWGGGASEAHPPPRIGLKISVYLPCTNHISVLAEA